MVKELQFFIIFTAHICNHDTLYLSIWKKNVPTYTRCRILGLEGKQSHLGPVENPAHRELMEGKQIPYMENAMTSRPIFGLAWHRVLFLHQSKGWESDNPIYGNTQSLYLSSVLDCRRFGWSMVLYKLAGRWGCNPTILSTRGNYSFHMESSIAILSMVSELSAQHNVIVARRVEFTFFWGEYSPGWGYSARIFSRGEYSDRIWLVWKLHQVNV